MTGLSVLLQSNALRQALSPYVLGGAHGKLLDADRDRFGSGDVQGFEMEELMHSPPPCRRCCACSPASTSVSTVRPRC